MILFTKKIQFFIKILLVLVGNVLLGNIVLDKEELINIDKKNSDSASINSNAMSKTDEAIIFVTEDTYVYGSENIFLQTTKLPKENKTKNTLTNLTKKKQNKSISKKKLMFTKTLVSKKHFHNTLEHHFFNNIFSENANFINTSNYFNFLHLEKTYHQKELLIKAKNADKFYFDSKIRSTSIVNLSDRAPPVLIVEI